MHIVNTGRAANKGGLRTNRRPVVRSPGTADIDCVTGTIRLTDRLLESAELVSPLGHFARGTSKLSSGLG